MRTFIFQRIICSVCAASVMATAIPVSAAEMVDPAVIAQGEDSISVAASCSCRFLMRTPVSNTRGIVYMFAFSYHMIIFTIPRIRV